MWGDVGMDALWSAATIKLLGAGLDDADFVEKISKLVGQHDVSTVSISKSKDGSSRSVSYRQENVLPPDQIRALPKGTALLLAAHPAAALVQGARCRRNLGRRQGGGSSDHRPGREGVGPPRAARRHWS